ncbi:hypothetical protein IFM89_022744 [Coptis chinensis]|uniref:Uncharacterized protein n=1 Tax=Coptis chinensis TaxID=261450 RepID=A0A835I3B2_9MAGN|nr:hypothetical protein IFM89_022744 [Coptis chinensis]
MQKDQIEHEETVDTLKRDGVPKDEMAALERQFAPESNNIASKDGSRKLGDGEDDDKIEIAHKDVPAAVFGDLVNKVEENNKDGDEETYSKLGALERIKRQRQGGMHQVEPLPKKSSAMNTLSTQQTNAEEALLKLHMTDMNTLGLGAVDSQKKKK